MVIDGNKIASEIKERLKAQLLGRPPLMLAIIQVGDNKVSTKYIARKQVFAESIGATVELCHYPDTATQAELLVAIEALNNRIDIHGIIIQLPLPEQLITAELLNAVRAAKDVDALSADPECQSPVVLAIEAILTSAGLTAQGKRAVVVGRGRLVGQPAAHWLANQGALVTALDDTSEDVLGVLRGADIIVAGAGSPHLIQPDMIKEGVILIDVGASVLEGKIQGDASPLCEPKCSVFTPVPGGVGPITVATLFSNLVQLNVPTLI